MFDTVFDRTFQYARRIWWNVNEQHFVKAQSVYWLYCWAQTGMGHSTKAMACREIFNRIFPFSFEYLTERVPSDYPRRFRYSLSRIDNDFIDQELDRLLSI